MFVIWHDLRHRREEAVISAVISCIKVTRTPFYASPLIDSPRTISLGGLSSPSQVTSTSFPFLPSQGAPQASSQHPGTSIGTIDAGGGLTVCNSVLSQLNLQNDSFAPSTTQNEDVANPASTEAHQAATPEPVSATHTNTESTTTTPLVEPPGTPGVQTVSSQKATPILSRAANAFLCASGADANGSRCCSRSFGRNSTAPDATSCSLRSPQQLVGLQKSGTNFFIN